jgi:enoyl-CoA hydratase
MMAAEAREWGLVNQVFTDHAALLDGVMAIAGEIATKSPIATVGNKEMLNYARDHSIADGLNYVATWNAAMLSRADLGEAFMAKQQKRDASYADLDPTRKLV